MCQSQASIYTLRETDTYSRNTAHHEVDWLKVPGQRTITIAGRARQQRARREQHGRTKELLGSLAFLNVGHFDGGETGGGGDGVEGGDNLQDERARVRRAK